MLAVVVPLALVACAALPTITFTQSDVANDALDAAAPVADATATVDAGEEPTEAAAAPVMPDAALPEASPNDGAPHVDAAPPPPDAAPPPPDAAPPPPDAAPPPSDAASSDPDVACPTSPPAGASICCGTVPCRGAASSCSDECTNCENNCSMRACCLDHNGNYQGCADSPTACPTP
jgi:hypothetical protein